MLPLRQKMLGVPVLSDQAPVVAANHRNVLIVDDNLSDLRSLMEVMKQRHFRLHLAFDGQDGWNKAKLIKPDLILLDMMMPEMDGFATCRLLKSHEATRLIPVIFLSAATEVEKRIEGLKLGAVDFITKPFLEEEVVVRSEIHLSLAKQLAGLRPPSEASAQPLKNVRDQALVEAAMIYLRENWQQLPSLEILARTLGCNAKKLNRIFQEQVGVTVFTWVREERLRQALSLLANTPTPIATIAEHLGYSSQANFAKAFHDRFGCSASQFRESLLLEPLFLEPLSQKKRQER